MNKNFPYSTLESTKNFWNKHKGKVAVIATISTIVVVAGSRAGMRTNQEFLKEHGLLEEFNTWLIEDSED